MKKLKYSPDAREKLKQIKQYVTQKFGADTANKVIKELAKDVRDLQHFENKGVSVESVLGIPCDYRMLYTHHNYVCYQIKADVIKIQIYIMKKRILCGSSLGLRLLQKKWRIIGKSSGNILATENQQAKINDVIEVETGVYLHKT